MGGSSSRDSNSGGATNQVSGYEAAITKQNKGTKKEINKNFNVSTFSDRNYKEDSSANKFINTDTKRNKAFKFMPVILQSGTKVLEGITDAPKKNRAFLINNYDKIGKNYDLPNKKEFLNKNLEAQQKIYTDMRQDFMRNNKNALGEDITGGGGYTAPSKNSISNIDTKATKQMASSGIVTNVGIPKPQSTPTTAEISQASATNAVEPSSSYTSNQNTLLTNKRKGRSNTILTASTGLGNSSLTTTKKTLGA